MPGLFGLSFRLEGPSQMLSQVQPQRVSAYALALTSASTSSFRPEHFRDRLRIPA